jgi:hypothetical protein
MRKPSCSMRICRDRASRHGHLGLKGRATPLLQSQRATISTCIKLNVHQTQRGHQTPNVALNRFVAAFASSNANAIVHGNDKNLTVANRAGFTGAATFQNRLDRWLDELIVDCNL